MGLYCDKPYLVVLRSLEEYGVGTLVLKTLDYHKHKYTGCSDGVQRRDSGEKSQ